MDIHALAVEWLDRPVKHPENTTLALEDFIASIRAAILKEAADRVRTSQHVYAEDCDGTTEPYPAIAVEDAIAAIMGETK